MRSFRHTGCTFKNVKFIDTEWSSDSYQGGCKFIGTDINSLIGVSSSHAVNARIIANFARSRRKYEMLAGWIDFGFMGCWQSFLHVLETQFSDSERREIMAQLSESPKWYNGLRLEFELMKYEMLCKEFGDDVLNWPDVKTRNEALTRQLCSVSGIEGHISKSGIFVPHNILEESRIETKVGVFDEMMRLSLESQEKINGKTCKNV